MSAMRTDWKVVEEEITVRLQKELEEWNLDQKEIKDFRLSIYKEHGWDYDPCAEDAEEDEEEDDDESSPYQKGYSFYSLDDWYKEFGLSYADFQ